MAVAEFESLGADAFVLSKQENLETIHQHNVVAERYGLVGELARELYDDEHVQHHVTMREWLESAEPHTLTARVP
jgi:GTP cyclohydrolase-4